MHPFQKWNYFDKEHAKSFHLNTLFVFHCLFIELLKYYEKKLRFSCNNILFIFFWFSIICLTMLNQFCRERNKYLLSYHANTTSIQSVNAAGVTLFKQRIVLFFPSTICNIKIWTFWCQSTMYQNYFIYIVFSLGALHVILYRLIQTFM